MFTHAHTLIHSPPLCVQDSVGISTTKANGHAAGSARPRTSRSWGPTTRPSGVHLPSVTPPGSATSTIVSKIGASPRSRRRCTVPSGRCSCLLSTLLVCCAVMVWCADAVSAVESMCSCRLYYAVTVSGVLLFLFFPFLFCSFLFSSLLFSPSVWCAACAVQFISLVCRHCMVCSCCFCRDFSTQSVFQICCCCLWCASRWCASKLLFVSNSAVLGRPF